jgi:hypothetical protein
MFAVAMLLPYCHLPQVVGQLSFVLVNGLWLSSLSSVRRFAFAGVSSSLLTHQASLQVLVECIMSF